MTQEFKCRLVKAEHTPPSHDGFETRFGYDHCNDMQVFYYDDDTEQWGSGRIAEAKEFIQFWYEDKQEWSFEI